MNTISQVEELVRRPLSAYPDVKTLTKVVREAVREAVNEERAVRGLQPTSVTGVSAGEHLLITRWQCS